MNPAADVGKWLSINGDAIYDTRPWKVFGEGPTQVGDGSFSDTKRTAFTSQDIRFTTKGRNAVYAIVLNRPENGEVAVQSLGANLRLYEGEVENVRLLGLRKTLTWKRDAGALRVHLPAPPASAIFTLEITRKA